MIFISHSTKDKKAAVDLLHMLRERGYAAKQLFLDTDEESGIDPDPKRWEPVLYARLNDCEVLLVVCSVNFTQSMWCFAEMVHAKSRGKVLLPVYIEECSVNLLADFQAVHLHGHGSEEDKAAAYQRLFELLGDIGIQPANPALSPSPGHDSWNGHCPYPGLNAFDEKYAGVYFGREAEVRSLRLALGEMRARGEPRWLMITGSSGGGKSSLLKAGLLPGLRHNWIVLPVLRPAGEGGSIIERLANNIAAAFPADSPCPGGLSAVRDMLDRGDAAGVLGIMEQLAIVRQQPQATVLLAVDQFEELLTSSAGPAAESFLKFCKVFFGSQNDRVLGIGTMRSEYLSHYQFHGEALAPPFLRISHLGPFPRERIRDVIQKPAERANFQIDANLVSRLERDTPNAEALPLLAFTLESLYRKYADDRMIELQEYEQLGGMEGALQKSVARVISRHSPSEKELRALQLSFVKHLVQFNDKNEPVRRTANWESLPPEAKPILEGFVEERLLVRSQSQDGNGNGTGTPVVTVEVVHDALFRCWQELGQWLNGSADILRWRRDVQRDRASDPEWDGLSRVQLAIARNWSKGGRKELEDEEKKWIKDGIRRQHLKRVGVAALGVLAVALAVFSWRQAAEIRKLTAKAGSAEVGK